MEKVVIKDAANQVFNVRDVKAPRELSFDLSGIWEVDATGLLQTQEDCPITEWRMCDDALCVTPSAKSWATIEGSGLWIDLREGVPLVNVHLAAITSGRVVGSQPMKVLICGQEQVSVVSTSTLRYQEFVGAAETSVDVAEEFKNTDAANCPITSYKLLSATDAPLSGVEATIVSLSGTRLSVKYTEPYVVAFKIVASTASGSRGTKNYNAIVDEIPNTPPKFSGLVAPTFTVQLVKGEDGELEDDSIETFTSPKAVDGENDQIVMSFTGGTTFMRVKDNDDDTFYIKVNKALLPQKSATYPVSVSLDDVRGAKQMVPTKMSVVVEFIDKYAAA